MPYEISDELAQELLDGYIVDQSDLKRKGEPTSSTPTARTPESSTTSATATTTPTPVPEAEIAEQIAQAEKDGNWTLAMQLKNRTAFGELKPPAPAPAPEPMSVDQLHAAIREAEAAGPQGVMRSIALKTQLLNMRENQ